MRRPLSGLAPAPTSRRPSPPGSGHTCIRAACPSLLALLILLSGMATSRLVRASTLENAGTDLDQPGQSSDNQSSTVAYGLKLLDAWQVEEAETFAKDLQKTAPDDPGTKYLLGRIAFEEGQYSKAVKLLKEALGPGAGDSDDYKLAVAAERENRNTVVEESAHFTIRYRPGKEAALIPYALDTMEKAYAVLTKDLGYTPPRKVRIEFYSSPEALARVSSLSAEAIKTTGTIALCKYNRLMVTSPRALWRGYQWEDTIAHEFTHFLVSRKSRNTVPIWIHEGIAKYMETAWRGSPGLALDAGGEALLSRAVKTHKLITFEAMYPSMALLPSQEAASTAFAEVFTFIQFVDRKDGMAGIRAIIDNLRAGMTDHAAVAKAVGMPFGQFEALWKKSLRSRPEAKVPPMIQKLVFKDERKPEAKKDADKAYDQGELGMIPNVQAREFAHLGELLRQRNRLVPAAIEYQKAIAIAGGEYPPLARKYALTKLALGEGADAEKVLRASLKMYPDDETNHLLLGRVLMQMHHPEEAKTQFLIANQTDPFDAEIHVGLLNAGKATGDDALVARETDVLRILSGSKLTWRAAEPGQVNLVGYLRVEAMPGARVFVDDVDTGLTSPVDDHPLTAGQHVVKLVPDKGAPVERTLTIVADQLVPFPQS